MTLIEWLMACHNESAHPTYRDERFKQAAMELRRSWAENDALKNAIDSHRRLALQLLLPSEGETMSDRKRSHLGSTVDGGVDDADREPSPSRNERLSPERLAEVIGWAETERGTDCPAAFGLAPEEFQVVSDDIEDTE